MSIKETVLSQFRQVAKEQEKELVPLRDDLPLLDSGLDSLCFAIIVSRLEDEFGVDPFGAAQEAGFPETVGAFVKFYEDAVKQNR